jgi:GNAT superfamily N-acetyltransferase
VAELALVEIRFRATPPIYGRPDRSSVDDVAAHHRTLRERGAVHFLGALDGRDVGLLTIEPDSPAPRLCPDGQPYIGPTATLPEARGRGVGRTLVDTALTWAHAHGYRWLSVDFESSNPLSRPFWLGSGFHPTGYCQIRAIHPGHRPS